MRLSAPANHLAPKQDYASARDPCAHCLPACRSHGAPSSNSSLCRIHSNKLPLGLVGQSWTATTFLSFALQRLSSAVNMAAAHEIRQKIARGHKVAKPARGGKRYRSLVRA